MNGVLPLGGIDPNRTDSTPYHKAKNTPGEHSERNFRSLFWCKTLHPRVPWSLSSKWHNRLSTGCVAFESAKEHRQWPATCNQNCTHAIGGTLRGDIAWGTIRPQSVVSPQGGFPKT